MSLESKIEMHPSGVVILLLEGRILTSEDFNRVNDLMDKAVNEGHRKFILPLDKVSHVNSSGLNLLLRLFTKARNKGGDLWMVAPSSGVDKLLKISKLNTVFNICANQTEALNQLNAQEA